MSGPLDLARRLENVTPPMLGHSLARRMLSRGAQLPEVQRVLGHSRISTTGIAPPSQRGRCTPGHWTGWSLTKAQCRPRQSSPSPINSKIFERLERSRHCNPINLLVNFIAGLIAYCHQPKKQSLGLQSIARELAGLIPNSPSLQRDSLTKQERVLTLVQ